MAVGAGSDDSQDCLLPAANWFLGCRDTLDCRGIVFSKLGGFFVQFDHGLFDEGSSYSNHEIFLLPVFTNGGLV